MNIKTTIRKIHLWLGLGTGLVVFIISITGCLYAFQAEIQDALQAYRFTEVENKPILPPSVFEEKAKLRLPQCHLHAINYPGKGRSVEAIYYGMEPVSHYYIVYYNPYSGAELHVQNMDKTFFRWVLNGHYYLWLPPNIGQPITAYSTLIFVFMLISGIVLWWPKNKKAAGQRFWFKWKNNTKWKRKNFDLHSILGFYSSVLLLIVAITGIVFGLQWVAYGIYKLGGGEKDLLFVEPVSGKKMATDFNKPAVDMVWEKMRNEHPDALALEVHPPETDSSVIAANVNTQADTYWKMDYRYFDQYTLKELSVNNIYGRFKDAKGADKLLRLNYDIHTGGIWGLSGKILAFLLSLVAASLPVTGFLMWWGKRNKQRTLKP